jgi:hypothetical protein
MEPLLGIRVRGIDIEELLAERDGLEDLAGIDREVEGVLQRRELLRISPQLAIGVRPSLRPERARGFAHFELLIECNGLCKIAAPESERGLLPELAD